MNIQYSNVRDSHLTTAKLITDSICYDILSEFYIVDNNVQFRTLAKMLETIAKKETSHNFGYMKSDVNGIKEWLLGLPSVITVPFTYYDIYQWGYSNNLLSESDNDDKHMAFAEHYWYLVALCIHRYAEKCRRDLISA